MGKTYLLVHGAWHGSLHWASTAARLSAQGHRVVAMDLPAHGLNARFPVSYLRGDWAAFQSEMSPVREITLDVGAEAVADVVKGLAPSGRPILVGHSAAGNVISRAAEIVPELLQGLVYVSAACPTTLRSAPAYAALTKAHVPETSFLYIGDPSVTGAFRINPRSPDPRYLEALHAVFAGETPFEAFVAGAHALTPDQPISFWTGEPGMTAERWGAIPRHYVRCIRDRALPLDVQDRMVHDADEMTPSNRFSVSDLDTDHSPFISCPERLAAVLGDIG